jgi:hypothetical protein
MKKEQDLLQQQANESRDPECTFKPTITEKSKNRAPRTVVELSRGDALHRQTMHRMLKLEKEKEELANLTFTPKLNSNSSTGGKLKILSEPDTYLARVQMAANLFNGEFCL